METVLLKIDDQYPFSFSTAKSSFLTEFFILLSVERILIYVNISKPLKTSEVLWFSDIFRG